MTEPNENDREMYDKIAHARMMGIADGRQQERARCAAIVREAAGDSSVEYGSTDPALNMAIKMGIALAKRILKEIERNDS